MMQGLTASHFATDFYPVQPGDVALVHAAAGGVGLLLTQIIKLRGGRVIRRRVTSGEGARCDRGWRGSRHRRTEGDFADEVIRLSGGDGVHVVYDGSGRQPFRGRSHRCVDRARSAVTARCSVLPAPSTS